MPCAGAYLINVWLAKSAIELDINGMYMFCYDFFTNRMEKFKLDQAMREPSGFVGRLMSIST
jgi:hypothetical protein